MADPLESIAESHEITNARPGDSFALREAPSEDDLIKLIQLFALHCRPYCSESLPRWFFGSKISFHQLIAWGVMFAFMPPAAKNAVAISHASPPTAAITSEVLTPDNSRPASADTAAPISPPNTATRPMAWIMPAPTQPPAKILSQGEALLKENPKTSQVIHSCC
jgi:hypothetical protein